MTSADALHFTDTPTWYRAEEEGNPQGFTYAARPHGPINYTRAQFSQVLRGAIALGREEERRAAIERRSAPE